MWLTKAHTSQEAPTSTSGSSSPLSEPFISKPMGEWIRKI